MNRRTFIQGLGLAAAVSSCPALARAAHEDAATPLEKGDNRNAEDFVRPALAWEPLEGDYAKCRLCPRECEVRAGDRGHCGVRENRDGKYHTLIYGRAVALNNDPIEKKPFNHFHPGSMVLSVAAAGCNIHCKFCQNWQISQAAPEDLPARFLAPEVLVRLAADNNIPNLAFTYSEPTVSYEYMLDSVKAASAGGIRPVVVSNGYIRPDALKELLPHLAAYKIDLKAFTEEYYRDVCDAHLEPILTTLETIKASGLWLEIVNLVLPTLNDKVETVRTMARWINEHLGPDVPLHFTRFQPMYRMRDLPPTPVATLETLHAAARAEGLRYVYVGNVPGHPLENTYCHNCGTLLIERVGLFSVESRLRDGRCPACQTAIPGVWS